MVKFRLYYDKDKATKWLNKLAGQGKALSGFFAGFFLFKNTPPGMWSYQIDFSEHFGRVNKEYRSLMNEMNIEILRIWGYWIFLRKQTADGPFELYTDVESKIEHYKKVRAMFHKATIIELACFLIEMLCALGMNTPMGWLFMMLLGLMTIMFLQQTVHTEQIITELMEQQGEQNTALTSKKKQLSSLLLIGFLLNICAMAVQPHTDIMHITKIILQISAIITMILGIIRTQGKYKKGHLQKH